MALDITAQDIVIDESTGLQDDDINPSVAPYSANTTLQYLLTLGTSLEVAFQSDFVVATASAGETINSIILTQNASGTPFSTTVGVNSGIQTADGNYVWLFQDLTHPNVVIGVIGTADPNVAPAANGSLAFSFGLSPASATHSDLYLVQYVPLLNPDTSNPDDRIDLTGKVYASVSGTTVIGFTGQNAAPGNHDFYVINSPDDASKQVLVTAFVGTTNATANVSTQGFGVKDQSINPTDTLQIDFVTGGTLAAGTGSQIQYGSHLNNITQAGFTINQITPSNPNLRVDITIKAFDNTGNEQGSDFFDGTTTNLVDITSIKLTGQSGFAGTIIHDGTYATGSGNITVTGLDGTGNAVTITGLDNVTTVDITTASQMDRLTITGVDSNEGCDVTEVHFKSQTTNAYTEQVGSFIHFDDDGPSISTTGTEPTLTVDETVLATNDTQSFAANFSSSFGADGAGQVTYALGITGTASGLVDTATNEAVVLSVTAGGVVEGRTSGTHDLVFTVSVDASGKVTLDQLRAVVHPDTSDPNDNKTLASDDLIQLTATITDKDGDHQSATLNIGQNLNFHDDGPSISTTGTEPTLTVDETVLTTNDTQSFAANFSSGYGADGAGTLTFALGFTAGSTGLVDTLTGQAVVLSLNGSVIEGRTATSNDLVFTVSVDGSGNVTLDQLRAVVHPTTDPNESKSLAADNLIQLTATITDKDGDHASTTLNIGQNLVFKDDGPTITVPFDGDQNAGNGIGTHETLANTLNASATGAFGYDIGADARPVGFYDATHSDFVDQNSGLTGVQIGLSGTITGGGGGNILTSDVTLASESATSATFNFTFTYDKDPAAGVQTGTAGGTLVFDKVNDTYTITLTDPLEGTSFNIIHTSELLSKEPTSNSGHPPIVLERLAADDPSTQADEDFYVQFTGNLINKASPFSLTSNGEGNSSDTTFTGSAHDMVSNSNETWVSATQGTNGVAGDTIQKGELLTLRFFNSDVGIVNEATQPTATADTIALKFDGIGTSEDLMLILDLTDGTNSITKAVYVPNSAIFRMGQVPSPYNGEFTLDNNDGLVIIEQNDYNAAGEHYVIQGLQIMQSGNGITGTAITLNGTTGSGGASTGTHIFDPIDNDVLKITDIGFSSTTTVSQTVDSHLDFSFQVADADGDVTAMQHILVDTIA